MESRPVIQTRGLTKRYGSLTAVNALDLNVHGGEVFGLLGPNGAGKTTTILMLLGLSEPSAGTARVLGLDPARDTLAVKRRVGYLPGNVGFYGAMTGRENLRYTARLNGLERDETEPRIAGLLEKVGLTQPADRRVETYSKGMRQRLGIADALVKAPSVIILDEPTVGIDPEGAAEVLALIRSFADDQDVAVLLSSHLLHQVQAVCNRIGIFVSGKMVAEGTMQELAAGVNGGSQTVELGTTGEPEIVEEALRSVTGIDRIELDLQDKRLWLATAEGDLRESIVRALISRGVGIWHLRRRGAELDELYRRYFERREAKHGDGR